MRGPAIEVLPQPRLGARGRHLWDPDTSPKLAFLPCPPTNSAPSCKPSRGLFHTPRRASPHLNGRANCAKLTVRPVPDDRSRWSDSLRMRMAPAAPAKVIEKQQRSMLHAHPEPHAPRRRPAYLRTHRADLSSHTCCAAPYPDTPACPNPSRASAERPGHKDVHVHTPSLATVCGTGTFTKQ